jgi:hypothetical protein
MMISASPARCWHGRRAILIIGNGSARRLLHAPLCEWRSKSIQNMATHDENPRFLLMVSFCSVGPFFGSTRARAFFRPDR